MKLRVLIIYVLFLSVNQYFFSSQAVSAIHVEGHNSAESENEILDEVGLNDCQNSCFFYQLLHDSRCDFYFFHENPALPVPIRPPRFSV